MKRIVTALLIAFVFVGASFAKDGQKNDSKNLIEYLKDENIGVRSSAAQLLGEQKNFNAVEPLMDMLKNDKNFRVRIMAAVALYKIGDLKALPALKKAAVEDKNSTVRRVASGIVVDWEKKKLTQM